MITVYFSSINLINILGKCGRRTIFCFKRYCKYRAVMFLHKKNPIYIIYENFSYVNINTEIFRKIQL